MGQAHHGLYLLHITGQHDQQGFGTINTQSIAFVRVQLLICVQYIQAGNIITQTAKQLHLVHAGQHTVLLQTRNLTKSFGKEGFRRRSTGEYESWLDSWLKLVLYFYFSCPLR